MATKVKITSIHKSDAWYNERDEVIGIVGYASNIYAIANYWFSFDLKYHGQELSFSCASFELA